LSKKKRQVAGSCDLPLGVLWMTLCNKNAVTFAAIDRQIIFAASGMVHFTLSVADFDLL
jgi:hypothetical protein